MLFGQPRTDVSIAGKASWGLQLGFERRERCRRDAAASRWLGDMVLEGLLQPPGRIRRKPRRHTMAVDAQHCSYRFAVSGLSAGNQIQGMQPLSFLAVGFVLHAPHEFGGTLSDGRHLLAHPASPSTAKA
jgi:hypothetical protein